MPIDDGVKEGGFRSVTKRAIKRGLEGSGGKVTRIQRHSRSVRKGFKRAGIANRIILIKDFR